MIISLTKLSVSYFSSKLCPSMLYSQTWLFDKDEKIRILQAGISQQAN